MPLVIPPKPEPAVGEVEFNIHKVTDRPRPGAADTLVVCCFSEFGCEVVGCTYVIPRLRQQNPDKYLIVVGWYGREYLYRHQCDEFWELKEQHQHLRECSRAFHFVSKTLEKVEAKLGQYGRVIKSDELGHPVAGHTCPSCGISWGESGRPVLCAGCGRPGVIPALFSDTAAWKKAMVPLPTPSAEKLEKAAKYLGPNPVGVFARARKCYGRNLQPEFYVKLISLLEEMGYTPVWMGEKQSTLPCPVPHVVDYSRLPESRDLELTLAIVSKLQFTVQFWTASSRLAGLMGTPYLIFESPDQIFGGGQEGYRIMLTTRGPKKVVFSHFLSLYEDHEGAMALVGDVIGQMERGDWSEVVGMVPSPELVRNMIEENRGRIGWH